ncbi:hypothetical protein [Hymenobacter latericus]|uniref:hypothetical protein n=1 Tax=Hymenobacter sp. YIM 151858-1 TaxID=2987688 RepID=UPI0022279D28|nr:hypothetical protein [Hymenobacter sp. YIM 151858-1]UYZ60128.1 hypothetical protein OIS50_04830 [Hymenobacter sp. YIM 151858-1]
MLKILPLARRLFAWVFSSHPNYKPAPYPLDDEEYAVLLAHEEADQQQAAAAVKRLPNSGR